MKICKQCKKEITKRINERVFCSNQCSQDFRAKDKVIICNCLQCNKRIKTTISQNQIYCSRKCLATSRKGITVENSGQFEKGIHPKTEFKKGGIKPKNAYKWEAGDKHPNWKGGLSSTKEYAIFATKKRRAMKMNAEGSHTVNDWRKLKKKYNYMCLCCKRYEPEIKLTEDHIVPLSKGGSDYIENIQPLCNSCNSRKQVKTINFINLIPQKQYA